jgi:hypothetical protein
MIVNQSNDGEPLSYPGVKDALVTAQPENYCPQTRSQVTAHPEHDLSADNAPDRPPFQAAHGIDTAVHQHRGGITGVAVELCRAASYAARGLELLGEHRFCGSRAA